MLCLRDPADPTNDLGRKAAAIKHAQATCRRVLDFLRRLSSNDSSTVPSYLSPVVGPVYELRFEEMERLKRVGQKLQEEKWEGDKERESAGLIDEWQG